MTARGLTDLLIARLFQPPCAACGGIVSRPLDGAVCERCWARIVAFVPPLCMTCGVPLPSWRAASLARMQCPRCRRRPVKIACQMAIGPYEGTLRAIVHALKYDGRRTVAPTLGEMMRATAQDVLSGADIVVPVPLHRSRQWRRGFNQAELLARNLGLPMRRLLRRVQPTVPQVSLPAAARHRNVRRAFGPAAGPITGRGVRCSPTADGLVVVLVDDVSTTGATLEACAQVLRDAGAAEVRAVTAARAVSARPR